MKARVLALVSAIASSSSHAAGPIAGPAFTSRCSMCHQRDGGGLPGQFPRLAGRIDKIAATPAGRRYLILVVTNGLAGPVSVDGHQISGFMPGFPTASDDEVARILTAAASAGGKKVAFSASEVGKVRGAGRMSATQVAAERQKLVAAKQIP